LRIQQLISKLTGIPKNYFLHKTEEMQVVKYNINEQFKIHHDSSNFHSRLLTALLYLNDVPEVNGGETWFPFTGNRRSFDYDIEKAIELGLKIVNSGDISGIKVKPNQGDAIIFFNLLPSGELDSSAVHAGMPVLTKYLHEGNNEAEGNNEVEVNNEVDINECTENIFNCMYIIIIYIFNYVYSNSL
jgi:prolyl 4-hydroxylase